MEDYSVTWNQLKGLLDKLFEDGDAKMAMGDIQRAVKKAWDILYDDMRKRCGDVFEDGGGRDMPIFPEKFDIPRYGMGCEYYDWKCPTCGKFLAYEPDIKSIPRRCQGCGQLLRPLSDLWR